MFLPLGDDVDKRTMPLIGSFLVAVNLLVFALEMRLAFDSVQSGHQFGPPKALMEFFHEWGLVPVDFAEGKFVGVFTYMFLHGSLMHLIGNMIVLWAFVHTLEDSLGQINFLFYYLLWGVVAGVAHAFMQPESEIPMVGASGAIAGMIGAYFIAFGAMTKIKCLVFFAFRPWRVDLPAGAFVGFWVISQLMGLAGETEEQTAGVAWYAHLGGFAIGAVTMLIAGNTDRKLVRNRYGELEMVEAVGRPRSSPTATAVAGESGAVNPYEKCQYCGTPFTDDCRIAPTLLKCSNPDCDRLTYVM